MKNTFRLLTVACVFLFAACDDEDEEANLNRTQLLTSGAWQISSSTVNPARDFNGDGTPETDLTQFIKPCNLDDITIYKTDKTYSEEEGATKCNPASPQVYGTGTWSLGNNDTELTTTATGASSSITYKIEEISANSLRLSQEVTDSSGATYTFTSTWKH
ncbi:lipocalin family protein [Adhaeribacter sp. BT258]|uniref:Lipocalin family protein n=1 Tax=Adhaeribacter terrigena TaxID=2793070 RepID=A0ABS1C3F8_9BACT|nr:lipocalin family protein [Adhaeribacter terrigena]MBK0403702.1 lipocalin family protein [Adhaeribacter terrigena]